MTHHCVLGITLPTGYLYAIASSLVPREILVPLGLTLTDMTFTTELVTVSISLKYVRTQLIT